MDLQPRTSGASASEFKITAWSLIGFVMFVLGEAAINAVMRVQTGADYDAISDVTFAVVAGALVTGSGVYTAARTSKKNTLAKVSGGIDPKGLAEMIVKAAKT